MTYSPAKYWGKRGRTFEAEAIDRGWWDAETPELLDLLSTLSFATVLEVGCGYGRVGASLLEHWPDITYTGMDVSPDLVEASRKRLVGTELICADLATWETDRTWDLVLAIGVLGHILPRDLKAVVAKLRRWAGSDFVAIDWDEVGASTAYQYGHDYRSLYGPDVTEQPGIGGWPRDPGDGRLTMWHVPS